jgi:hypothetical protein
VTSAGDPTFRERLWPSWWLWLVTFVLAGTLGIAVGVAAGAGAGWIVALGGLGVTWWALWRGAWVVAVEAAELRVGPVRLPLSSIGRSAALDAAAARRLRGVEADARAFTVLRPWITTGVRVDLLDDVDPTPYWLVACRRPQALAEALAAVAAPRGG